ncbi:hypothetical protein EVAR_89813_1 [Eumeta japonica]|uniref:Uncharacterized protein n=1 Tax=Eumeta variegata TaxID=151549 RepID=A0A4C1YFG2_EUMVA|nr:hypothetical protein EVAR_89813_1 [Eumeta japonica]
MYESNCAHRAEVVQRLNELPTNQEEPGSILTSEKLTNKFTLSQIKTLSLRDRVKLSIEDVFIALMVTIVNVPQPALRSLNFKPFMLMNGLGSSSCY